MISRRFLKNNFIVVASTAIGGLLGYFFHFVIARKLSVAQYGELQAIISLSIFFGVLASALSVFIIKYSAVFSSHQDKAGQAHFIAFIFRRFKIPIFGLLILFLILFPALKKLLHLADYFGLVAIGLSIIFGIVSAVYMNSLQGWKKFLVIGAIGVSTAFLKLASGFLLASFSPSASAVSFSIFLSVFLGWLLAIFFAKREWPERQSMENKNEWREKYFSEESFKKSFINIVFFSLALIAVSNLDIMLVKNMVSSQIAGYYAALSVLGKIILWVNLSVVAVLLPDAFSLGHKNQPADSKTVLGSYMLIFIASISALFVYRLFPHFLVGLLFGAKYVIISENLWLFGLAAFFLSILTLEANLALARRDFRATYLLGTIIFVLVAAIHLFHADLQQIILSVTFSFSLGWFFVLALNLKHRLAHETESQG